MADLNVTLPELHKKDEVDDPIARLLQFKPEPSQDSTKIVVPVPVIAAPAPAPVITAPAPAPVITAPAPAPVITAPAPAPVITAPVPAPVIAAPAPAPSPVLAHAPAMPFKHNLPLAPIAPILPNQPHTIHAPEVPVVQHAITAIIKSHRNIGMRWHEPGQEFNVVSKSGSVDEIKKLLSTYKGIDMGLFDQFVAGAEKNKNIGPLLEGVGHATMIMLEKSA